MARKTHDLPADIRAEQKREARIHTLNTFAETMHGAQLPEPFAGAVRKAVGEWHALIDIALWEELRAENAEARVDKMFADYDRLNKGDVTHPFVVEIVEAVTNTAMSKFIAILARDAGVRDSVMVATVAALTGQPVPPALQDEVFELLEQAAANTIGDTQEAAS